MQPPNVFSPDRDALEIVPFEDKYGTDFRNLNEAWISHYFSMEEKDYYVLDHPREHILDKGGDILVALWKGKPVGVCALLKMEDPVYDFEMAKMAVSPEMQGRNIGWHLAKAIIELAKRRGGRMMYLESNSLLQPALKLYHKLGFTMVHDRSSPYERVDVQMELRLG